MEGLTSLIKGDGRLTSPPNATTGRTRSVHSRDGSLITFEESAKAAGTLGELAHLSSPP
jgi:hypothetical protein